MNNKEYVNNVIVPVGTMYVSNEKNEEISSIRISNSSIDNFTTYHFINQDKVISAKRFVQTGLVYKEKDSKKDLIIISSDENENEVTLEIFVKYDDKRKQDFIKEII